jgi:hypothetical protein
MDIRGRIGRALLGDEIERLNDSLAVLREAYFDGPYDLPPDELVRQLSEYDSALLYDLVNQIEYETIAGVGYTLDSDAARIRAVDEARRLYRTDAIVEWAVHTWTNYGFGQDIQIEPVDEAAKEVWDEFWTADRNHAVLAADEIQTLSEDVLTDGDVFQVFFASTLDGESQMRTIDTKEIDGKVITDPGDAKAKLFYKRQWTDANGKAWTMYYPDWRAFFSGELDKRGTDGKTLAERVLPRNAERADQQNENTVAVVLHSAHNRKKGVRGWPITTTAASWSRIHGRFRQDRASAAATVAMFVQKVKTQGGKRAIDGVRNKLRSSMTAGSDYHDTNPPAPAGSTWLENEAATLERLPMSTGASDAKIDGDSLFLMVCLGLGLFPHYAGAGDSYRLATATSMERPIEMQFSRYQAFWSAQFRKMVRIVLQFKELYGGAKFSTYDAEVSTDRLVEVDLESLSASLSALFRDTLTPYTEMGAMPMNVTKGILAAVWRIVLQAVGVADATEIISDETMGVESPVEATGLAESHEPEEVAHRCPLCGEGRAFSYSGHAGLLVCAACGKTYDPELE